MSKRIKTNNDTTHSWDVRKTADNITDKLDKVIMAMEIVQVVGSLVQPLLN